MSKEAVGQNGAVLGSPEYWIRINRSTFLGSMMQNSSGPYYGEAIQGIGQRAASAISSIYDDLQGSIKSIPCISAESRNSLINQVIALRDVCAFAGISCFQTSDCISILNLSKTTPIDFTWYDPNEIKAALQKIRGSQYFFPSECISLIKSTINWGIEFTSGNDKHKKSFLEDIVQKNDKGFLQEVLDTYQSDADTSTPTSTNGIEIGSCDYIQRVEESVFSANVPFMYSARFGTPNYLGLLKSSLDEIACTLGYDLQRNDQENNYITDETALVLKETGQELSELGINISIDAQVSRLAWFVGGDQTKIRQLQSKLNSLGAYGNLTEDGVYGQKTLQAWTRFLNDLEHGTVPTLCWIDVLQSDVTGITIGSTKNGGLAGLNNAFVKNGHPYIRFDPAPLGTETAWVRGIKTNIDYPHINFDKMPDSNWLYDLIQKNYNHYPLSDDAYNVLKDLKSTGKKVRIAGRVLLIAGVALDALELGVAINDDLHDADRKLGKTTASTAASIGGRWAGGAVGAQAGAAIGAMTGPLAPIAIPILSVIGGISGTFGGDKLASWVVDITYAED